jgi:sugar lactone lactonase YvrE
MQTFRVNLDNPVVQTIVSENVRSPDGLAVDWVHGHVYWTDSSLKRIEVATLDGQRRKVLFDEHLEEPRGITVDPKNG